MVTSPLAYPLHWPAELPRSRSRGRSPFKVSLSRAVADLQDSLRLFGADTGMPVRHVVISSNVTLGAARPSDPGVAVYFEWDGAQRCVAVDRFPKPEDNVRAIYYVLEARRQEMRYGGLHIVRAAFRGFSALPPPRRLAGGARRRPRGGPGGGRGRLARQGARGTPRSSRRLRRADGRAERGPRRRASGSSRHDPLVR